MYQPDDLRTLFVGDLSVYCSENDLQTLFSQFGPIEKITIKRGVSGSTNLSYGFVKFYHRESAEAATAMKGMMCHKLVAMCSTLFLFTSQHHMSIIRSSGH